jgi:broad specificity phosphatase PhoE
MKPRRILLIRHGESEGNVDKTVYGLKPDYALRLTDRGRAQARAAGLALREMLGDDSVMAYVSPLFRTRETFRGLAEAFAPGQVAHREDPRLREQEWGHLRDAADCDRVDAERDAYGTFYFRIPDGESAADVFDRVSDFLDTLHRDFEKPDFPPACLLVTHGMTLRLFLMRWFHLTVEDFETLRNPPNCAIVQLELQHDGKYRLLTEMARHTVKHAWRMEG